MAEWKRVFKILPTKLVDGTWGCGHLEMRSLPCGCSLYGDYQDEYRRPPQVPPLPMPPHPVPQSPVNEDTMTNTVTPELQPHQLRVVDKHARVASDLDKLEGFLRSEAVVKVGVAELELLHHQADAMRLYRFTLVQRMRLWGVQV